MSDDISEDFLRSRDVDPELEAANARMAEISRKSADKGFFSGLAQFHGKTEMSATEADVIGGARAGAALMKLPRNITVAVMDAAMNTIDAMDSASRQLESNLVQKETQSGEDPLPRFTPQALRENQQDDLLSPEFMSAGRQLRSDLARNSNTFDEVTQSAAQFFIPFTGYMKALGGLKRATKIGKVAVGASAEIATMMTSFEPHESRFADLLRLADTNNGLVNSYIDYMAASENEGELEGRLKNTVDGLVSSAALVGLIKSGAVAIKAAKKSMRAEPAAAALKE